MSEFSGEKPIKESSQLPIAQPTLGQSSTMSDVPEQNSRRLSKVVVLIVLLIMVTVGGVLGYYSLKQPKTPASVSAPSPSVQLWLDRHFPASVP